MLKIIKIKVKNIKQFISNCFYFVFYNMMVWWLLCHPHGPEEVSPDEADDDISFDDPKQADHGNKKHVV